MKNTDMYICKDGQADDDAPRRCAGGQWLVIVEEDPALMPAGMQPRVSRRIRFSITVAPYPLHISPVRFKKETSLKKRPTPFLRVRLLVGAFSLFVSVSFSPSYVLSVHFCFSLVYL